MNIEIRNDIPIPPAYEGRGMSKALRFMEVGQSFVSDKPASIKSIASRIRKETGRTFAIRKGEDGWRIWRTA